MNGHYHQNAHSQRLELSSTDPNATRMMERMFRSHTIRGDGLTRNSLNRKYVANTCYSQTRYFRIDCDPFVDLKMVHAMQHVSKQAFASARARECSANATKIYRIQNYTVQKVWVESARDD